jgi:hypothetical protein
MVPEVDFDSVPDADEGFDPLPEGSYTCKVTDVEEQTSKAGNEMWAMTWEVQGGEYHGRRVWDRLVFSDKAMPRVKLCCHALGIDTRGRVNLLPEMLLGRSCILHVEEGEYERDGRMVPKNVVPFAGFESIDDDGQNLGAPAAPPPTEGPPPVTDSDIPFAWLLPLALAFLATGMM